MLRRCVVLLLVLPALSALGALTGPSTAATAATAAAAQAGAPSAVRMPGDVPSKRTPWVLDGEVTKIVQVGDTMVAGGLFTQVADPMGGTVHARQNLVAFDASTGLVSTTFAPTLDGQVQQLAPGPTPGTVYVAGDFTKVNGKGPNHLQLLDVTTGLAVPGFRAPTTNGGIETMELLPGGRLFIGGFFTKVGGVAHGQLATLDAATGALDPFLDLTVAGNHNTGAGAKAPVGIREAGLTPAGDRMVVVGNFRTVDGLARDQIVMLDLTGPTAAVATDWYTTGYTPICSPNAFDSYVRDVEMSPDGSFFVVATTGGPHSGTLCDTAARFETYAVGTSLLPTWTDASGGDTLWGVEITRAAVFVGGHNRWMNNPSGSDRAGQGAVPRPGLSALDPDTGVPLRWNPGRNPRGEAAYEIHETETGVWVLSDTDWIGDRRYQRPRIAFFPYAEGYDTASEAVGTLPGSVYVGAPLARSDVLYRVNAGGAAIASTDAGPDWSADNATTNPLRTSGSTTTTYSPLPATSLVGVPATVPLGIWTQDRVDPVGGAEMQWSFPVTAGRTVQVRLYLANRSTSIRRFSVIADGVTRLSNYDPAADPGYGKGTVKTFDVVSDGRVDLEFRHGVLGNPFVNAIELVDATPGSAGATQPTSAAVVGFDGSAVTSQQLVETPGFDWSGVRAAVMVGRTLFYAQSDAMLYRRSFDGTSFGPASAVDPYRDPRWSSVETGSGPTGQTYAGVLPTFYSQLPSVTGMFVADGRLFYTRSGQNALFWRWFSPDSGVVGGVEGSVTGSDVAWGTSRGLFLAGGRLFVVTQAGQLQSVAFEGGVPSGTAAVADASLDWRGRAVFLSSVLPNVAPTAAFTDRCTGTVCELDATSSGDPDGSVQSYEWAFGDGDEAGGPTAQKDFGETGTWTVSLTVTDDGGLSSTTTREISVVRPNAAPTAAFGLTCTWLACDADAAGSSDPDGVVASYAWSFDGVGSEATGPQVHHVFDAPGSHEVRLVVTDDEGASDVVATTRVLVGEPAASTVTYAGSAATQANSAAPAVTAPASVAAGDRLLLALTLNASTRVVGEPTGAGGWTVLDTVTSGSSQTRLWTRVATAADAGTRVVVPLDGAAKHTLTLAAYAGTRGQTPAVATLAESQVRAAHTTPEVQAPAGAWLVSYWADKSSATSGFALPDTVTGRQALCSAGTGHVCSAWADSAGPVPTGAAGGLTATADATSGTATTASVVLRPVEANQPPTAVLEAVCDGAVCDLDASGSTDVDGRVSAWAWDFGDGTTETTAGPRTTHRYDGWGPRTVSVTVTDDEGATAATTRAVDVAPTRPVAAAGSSVNQGNVATPNATVPTTSTAGDRLVLFLSLNSTTVTPGLPGGVTGWTQLDRVAAGTMTTYVFTKVAAEGDAGRTVRFAMDGAAKYTLTVGAWTGAVGQPVVSGAAETTVRADHTTPVLTARTGDWVVGYWADKSSATTGFALPDGVTPRQAACSSGTGRICSVLADAGPLTTGPTGGLIATADAASGSATTWSVLLPQG